MSQAQELDAWDERWRHVRSDLRRIDERVGKLSDAIRFQAKEMTNGMAAQANELTQSITAIQTAHICECNAIRIDLVKIRVRVWLISTLASLFGGSVAVVVLAVAKMLIQ